MLEILLVFLFATVGFYFYTQYQKYKSINVQSPKCRFPYIGHFCDLFGVTNQDYFKKLNLYSSNFPIISKIWLFGTSLLYVNDPDLIKSVLTADVCLEKPSIFYKFLHADNGLTAAEYSKWKHDRKIFNQSFNIQVVKNSIPTFNLATNRMIEKIANHQSPVLNLLEFTENCSIEMITASSLGLDIEDPENEKIFKGYQKVLNLTRETFNKSSKNPLMYWNFIYKMSPACRAINKANKDLDMFQKQIRRKNLETEKVQNDLNSNESLPNLAINRLIQNSGVYTDKEINDHVFIFITGGYETTSYTIANCLLVLAMHQDIQEEVLEEILQEFPTDDDSMIDIESLAKLELLDRVLKETLRLIPVFPIVARETMDDFEITPNLVIPKGTVLCINNFVLHRRKSLWGSRADDFYPDHFLPENVAKRHPYSYNPFSAGKRNCIGYRYAGISMKIMMMKALKAYKFTTTLKYDEMSFESNGSLNLCSEHLMSVKKRVLKK
ncbi:unnamed protein product [Diamesa serratosioi]